MTTHHRHLTRALMIVALAVGAWTAAEAASHDTAVAADMPSAEHPGGVLGGRLLPERASDVAEAVLDLPEPEPEPREEPEQEPVTEPEEPATGDRPAEPPADPIVEVPPLNPPPITVDPIVVDPIVIDVPPVVVPVLPVVIPALPAEPAPGAPSFGPIVRPAPVSPPTAGPIGEPVPQPVPAVIGPAPDDDPAQTTVAAGAARETPPCSISRPAPDRGRGAGRAVTDQGGGLPATRPAPPLGGGCPSVPDGDDNALNLVAMKPPSGSAVDLIADHAALLVGDPAMVRLGVLRPRSHLPAGSPTRIDPRPA